MHIPHVQRITQPVTYTWFKPHIWLSKDTLTNEKLSNITHTNNAIYEILIPANDTACDVLMLLITELNAPWHRYEWATSHTWVKWNVKCTFICVTWLVFICVTWLIFICVTWLVFICVTWLMIICVTRLMFTCVTWLMFTCVTWLINDKCTFICVT